MIDLPKTTIPLVIIGDALTVLRSIPDKSINLVITSPPYWSQRDYGVKDQIGNEKTPEEYIEKLLEVAKEIRRVLTDDGAYFLNIGDKYVDKNLQMIPFKLAIEMQRAGWVIRNVIIWHKTNAMPSSIKDRFSTTYEPIFFFVKSTDNYLTPEYYFNLDEIRIPHKSKFDTKGAQKSLIPETNLPFTLSEDEYKEWKDKIPENRYHGKFINQNKVNLGASPGARLSVYGEFYSKQRKYDIDTKLELEIINFLREHRKKKGISIKMIDKLFGYRYTAGHWFRTDRGGRSLPQPEDWIKLKQILEIKDTKYDKIMTETHYVLQTVRPHELGKNPGDVWSIPTDKLQEKHFAIFPEELPRIAIKACCPKNGIVLDPFVGSGTTLKVAKELGRKSIGIEIQKEYLSIIKKRCGNIQSIFDLNLNTPLEVL